MCGEELKITKPWAKVEAEVEKIGKEITRKILEYLNEFLLDTSYVLPLVGIEVEEISGDIYSKILAKKLYYPDLSCGTGWCNCEGG